MAPGTPAATAVTKIHDAQGWFSASVEVDDQPVPVYKVEHPSDMKTTCYVEAQEGKEFKVVFTNSSYHNSSIAAFLKLDGTESGGYTIETVGKRAVYESKRISVTTVRPFMFAKLNLTDDADLATADEHAVKNLGTIQIELYRVHVVGTEYKQEIFKEAKQHTFDERSKKATLSHQAGYGAAKSNVDSGKRVRCDYVDRYGSPFKVLEFKYRSRALLELDDIIEPEPAAAEASPPPAPVASSSSSSGKKRQAISLSPDANDHDLRAKVAKLEAENAALKKVKAEPGVKREPVAGGSKVKGEKIVIDLCDDSD
ncbi:hypothetical protein JCM11251_002177 [Rhodosporidiobolus azoricus]